MKQHLSLAAIVAALAGLGGGIKAFTDWAISTNEKISISANSQARYIQTVNALVQASHQNTQDIQVLKRKLGLRSHARKDTLVAIQDQPQEGLVRKFLHLLF